MYAPANNADGFPSWAVPARWVDKLGPGDSRKEEKKIRIKKAIIGPGDGERKEEEKQFLMGAGPTKPEMQPER